jgi:hypothetical protein
MAAPNDGVTLSELERKRLREIEDGLARLDGAFVARFAASRGMRLVLAGAVMALLGLVVLVATFAHTTAGGFAGALVIAAGLGLSARGAQLGGVTGWVERVRHERRGR